MLSSSCRIDDDAIPASAPPIKPAIDPTIANSVQNIDECGPAGANRFQNCYFPHPPVSRTGNARSQDHKSAKYRKAGDEPDRRTDPVDDILNNVRECRPHRSPSPWEIH